MRTVAFVGEIPRQRIVSGPVTYIGGGKTWGHTRWSRRAVSANRGHVSWNPGTYGQTSVLTTGRLYKSDPALSLGASQGTTD